MKNTIRLFALVVMFAFAAGCKGGGASDIKQSVQKEACSEGCEKTKTECVEKCSKEIDQDACKLACDEARDKCMSECTDQK